MAHNEQSKSPKWIEDGQKFSLLGLKAKVEGHIPFKQFAPNLWAMGDETFKLPTHWREWIGSIHADEIESCNLFLLSKMPSASAEVDDGENQKLTQNVQSFYGGLLLASTFAPSHKPALLTGYCLNGVVVVRSQSEFAQPIPHHFLRYPPILPEDIDFAAKLAEQITAFHLGSVTGGHWRFSHTLSLYMETRTKPDILEQIHQYCRCIDGLIFSDAGKAKRQFKSRIEIFIGAGHHDLMGDTYEVRSAVEHLNERQYLEPFVRETRLDLLKKAVIVEFIARNALARILSDANLWPHFANNSSLEKFWKLDRADKEQLWGKTFDLKDALVGFDPQFFSNGQLGAA